MGRRILGLLLMGLGLVFLVGCALAPGPTPTPSPSPTSTPLSGAEEVVALAKEALALQLGISEDKVQVVSVREAQFAGPTPGPGAGVPLPERQFVVVLEAEGETYIYQGGHTPAIPSLPDEAPPVPTIPPEATSLVNKAIKDLAQRRGYEEVSIVPMRVEAVTWPDASLGVPEKGKAYLPKLTPGFLIILVSPGGSVSYHSDLERVVFAGVTPEEGVVIIPRADAATTLVNKAKDDLAQRLSIAAKDIAEVRVEVIDWPDSSLGLGGEGAFLPVITPGYRITLKAQGQQYLYHTDMSRAVYAGTAPPQP